jgi:hypothetical protein
MTGQEMLDDKLVGGMLFGLMLGLIVAVIGICWEDK